MGGRGERLDSCAREIYGEWAACQHFELYEDVAPVLRRIAAAGVRIGLISNSHRCLASFQSHFELQGLIAGAISSPDHGFMKPHPSIFQAALRLVDVPASEAVMVGDSVRQDVEGALGAGMRAVLVHRAPAGHPRGRELASAGVPVVRSLSQLPDLILGFRTREKTGGLARRPGHGAAAEQVQVNVKDGLPGVAVGVEDRPEPRG